jgi:hypothetical protein
MPFYGPSWARRTGDCARLADNKDARAQSRQASPHYTSEGLEGWVLHCSLCKHFRTQAGRFRHLRNQES